MSYVTKNYSDDGGNTLVIGGKLEVEKGAEVIGLEGGGKYTLPVASADTLGGVKVGDGLAIDETGVLSAGTSALPVASADTLGGVKVGEGLGIDETGVLSAGASALPVASADTLGGVKVGEGLAIDETGVDHAGFHGRLPSLLGEDLHQDLLFGIKVATLFIQCNVEAKTKQNVLFVNGNENWNTDEIKMLSSALVENNYIYKEGEHWNLVFTAENVDYGGTPAKIKDYQKAMKKAFAKSTSDDYIFIIHVGHGDGYKFGMWLSQKPNIIYKFDDYLKDILKFKAKHIFLFIDTCHSGAIAASWGRLTSKQKSRISIVYSTEVTENSQMHNDKKYSLFTKVLYDAFASNTSNMPIPGDASGDGYITISELGDYVKSAVSKITNNSHPGYVSTKPNEIVYSQKQYEDAKIIVSDKMSLHIGEEIELKYHITGFYNKVSFSSSDNSVVSVDKKGILKGLKAGTAKITIKAEKATQNVTVTVNKENVATPTITPGNSITTQAGTPSATSTASSTATTRWRSGDGSSKTPTTGRRGACTPDS